MNIKNISNLYHSIYQDEFKRALSFSIIFHLFLVIASIIFSVADFDFLKSLTRDVTTIQSAVRVDVVAMPKFTVQELKNMKLPPVSFETSNVPAEVEKNNANSAQEESDLTFKEKGKKNLTDLLKNISQKDLNIKKAVKKEEESKGNSRKGINSKELNKLILEGNKLSKGAALVGESTEEVMAEFNQYANSLPDIVKKYWKLPSYLMDSDLKCRIRIYISSKGKLLKAEIYESSGVEEYDQKALTAVNKIQNFPIPPENIIHRVSSGDVLLGFPL